MSNAAQGKEGQVKQRRLRRNPLNARGQERQHFLLTSAAVTIGEGDVARLSHEEAYDTFKAIRFAENGGAPFCPHCGTVEPYEMVITRKGKNGPVPTPMFKCRACRRKFSVTSGTIFNSRKLKIGDILHAILAFVDAVSGEAALRLRRAIRCSYKTAFVLEGKLREAIAASRVRRELSGTVEVDGTSIGGKTRKAIKKKHNRDGRKFSKKKQYVVAVRERGPNGESRVTVGYGHELNGFKFANDLIADGSHIVTDEGWDFSHLGRHETVNHSREWRSDDGVNSNQVESLFARLKRAEKGVHYRIAGHNLDLYAEEISWREDHRRLDNEAQWRKLIHAATHHPTSRRWSGYWQRWQHEGVRRRNRPWKIGAAEQSVTDAPP